MPRRLRLTTFLPITAAAWAGVALLSIAAAAPDAVRPLGPRGAPAGAFPGAQRPVADIVSPIWGDERQRDLADESRQLTERLGIRRGQTVADIGAGAGYDSLRLARIVGPRGRVIAEDVKPEYLSGLLAVVQQQHLANVVPALGEPADPRLKPRSVDVAIMIHMYHEITAPYAFLYNLAPAMKPGGRVGVMDLARETAEHGTPPGLLRCEFEAVGYRQVGFAQLKGGIGYLAVFTAPSASARPRPGAIRTCRTG